MDLTKIRQVASMLALLARSLGFCWGGCTRSHPLACTCVGFACVFGWRELQVVTVVTKRYTKEKEKIGGHVSRVICFRI